MGDPALNKKVGERVKKLRKVAKITQNQLSEKAGCSTEFLSRLERGATAASIKRLNSIAKALGVPLKSIFDFPEEREYKECIEEFIVYKRSEDGELLEERYGVYQSTSDEAK